jgi:hypothetical protein
MSTIIAGASSVSAKRMIRLTIMEPAAWLLAIGLPNRAAKGSIIASRLTAGQARAPVLELTDVHASFDDFDPRLRSEFGLSEQIHGHFLASKRP